MSILTLYLLFVVGGVGVELASTKLYFHITQKHLHKAHFTFGRYFFLLTFPLLGTALIINLHGLPLFKIFLTFSLIGPVFEWLVGFSYHQTVGTRLWMYRKYTFLGHTSLLTAPLWGMAGVLFYLIAQMLSN